MRIWTRATEMMMMTLRRVRMMMKMMKLMRRKSKILVTLLKRLQ